MSVTIQLRRGTASAWSTANPVLAVGEIGLVTDDLSYKIGDGVTAWNSLAARELTGEFVSALFDAYDAATEPTPPAAGFMRLYSKDVAGRMVPKFVGPAGIDTRLQPALDGNGIEIILPASSTAFAAVGCATWTAVGTVSHPALAAGSLRASTRRAIVTSAATAASASELRQAVTRCWRGDAAGQGGFFMSMRFGASSSVAGQRLFCGLMSATGATSTSQDPAALTNVIGVGNAAADANLQVLTNDGTGTCTKVDLGASFPVPSGVNNALYELVLFAAPNAASVGWCVTRLDTGAVASGTISADLPAASTFLAPHLYINNNGVASAVVLEYFRYYLESDS
jgi:hypothetical protein